MLRRWNASINLVSRSDTAHLRVRHTEDALQVMGLIPAGTARAIDLGSGAGFPGLVLAIATGIPFDLVEADNRKASFLREAARATLAPATIHASRIETVQLTPAPLITARALAPLPNLLSLAAPLLAEGGICLFPKGENVEREIDQARTAWTLRIEKHISRTDPAGVILRVSEVMRV